MEHASYSRINRVFPPASSVKLRPPCTFSLIPSSDELGILSPRWQVILRMASKVPPAAGERCTRSRALPPSKFAGRPCTAPLPNEWKLRRSSAVHVPLANTLPPAFLWVKLPAPEADFDARIAARPPASEAPYPFRGVDMHFHLPGMVAGYFRSPVRSQVV